ncbi:unnamed protein product [Adineta steineri]|uniref:Polyketide synthase n=1 Tax=Adineta steineri TaxID=433720 RepID=A0A815DIG0_9BILA|nr:unnamed protein product [Adineta steineri]CAF1296838.1 unnamed protein product [Adineta steineri]
MSTANSNNTSLEPIALIGIACEFAGDIHSSHDLWHALKESRDVGSATPRDRFDLESYLGHMLNMDNNGQFRQKLLRAGYFMSNHQWDMFEASFFDLSDAEAGSIDPCHRLLMLKFVHLLDDAGYSVEKVNGTRTSVHIGQFSTDHSLATTRMKPEHRSRFHGPNTLLYNASARLSYHFNLQGPNVSLDVACSSSFEALHMAVQCLRTNEADMAVCGGVNGVFAPENFFQSSLIGAQSPDGRSRSFSADANGYAKGDGLGLLLLKRLSDAERDGDRIYCVVRDVLSGHDGNEGKTNFVVPSAAGQERLLANIYSRNNFDTRRILFVEAHGTGTPVGDPIEANALGRFFNRSNLDPPLLLGSIKSNLGHTEGAAGVASLIKVAMCMHYRGITPNMQFTSLNPKIEAQKYNLHIVQNFIPFPSLPNNEKIAIGVNSFGMGGTTTHAIIEEYQSKKTSIENGYINGNHIKSKQYFTFIFSTKSRQSLNDQLIEFSRWLETKPVDDIDDDDTAFLQRISQQLLLKRTISYTYSAIFVFLNRQQLHEQINAFLTEQASSGLSIISRPTKPLAQKICFVFSGQGPQWWAMGRQLYESEPLFHKWINLIDAEMTKVNNGEWKLLEELIEKKTEQDSRINDTNIAQPSLFAIQVALAALLVSWNIYPSSIISHSAGDQAAAFVAGRLTLEEAVRVVYHRSRLQNRNTRQDGRMLAVSMSEEEAQNKLLKGIEHLACIAVVNSPRAVTISGDEKTIDEIQQILSISYPNIFKARLRIENAFHSYQMNRFDIEKEMLSSLKDIQGFPLQDFQQMFNPKCAEAHLYSSVTGNKLSDQIPVDAHYWWSNVRQCVRFRDAMASIQQHEAPTVFLELSPHPVLATSIRECYELTNQQQSPLILPTLKRKENEQITLLTSLVQLTTSSHIWQQYFHTRQILPMKNHEEYFDDFPLYTFHLNPCWYESKDSAILRLANRIPTHPLLGIRQLNDQSNPTWKSLININLPQHAFLKDHKIQDAILFPAVAYLELAIAACHQLLSYKDDEQQQQQQQPTIIFEDIEFVKALILNEHELIEVFTQVIMPMREWYIYSRPWSAAGPDCMRPSGMNCADVVEFFHDQNILNKYSLNEFTLHAHGKIEINYKQQKSLTIPSLNTIKDTWSTQDITSAYAHLSTRGYQYGSSFQKMKTLRGTKNTAISELSNEFDDNNNNNNNDDYYLLHPSVMDATFHPYLVILPGIETTFLPVRIQKFIYSSKIKTKMNQSTNVEVHGIYHDNICGIGQEGIYTLDIWTFPMDKKIDEPVFTMENLFIQQVQGVQSGRWSMEKTIYDKLNITTDLPNKDHRTYLDTILKDYCMKRVWTDSAIIKDISHLLPSPNQILNNELNSNSNQDLIESIEPFNELAAYYAQMAIKDLDLNHVNQQQPHHPLLNACQSLASTLYSKQITWHSTQLRLIQLIERFPRLKPFLIILNRYGLHLKDILSGKKTGLDIFLDDDEFGQIFQEIKTLISATKTQQIFHSICQHLQLQYEQIKNNSSYNYRLRIFWLTDSDCSDILPILDLLLNLSQQTGLLIDLHYADSDPIQLANAKQTFDTYIINQTNLSIIYDETIDLYDNKTFEKIPIESFGIIFSVNQLRGNKNLTNSLIALRRLLVPNGLLLLLELIHVPLYFDFIFGFIDEWWSSTNNICELNNIQLWTTFLKQIEGFNIVESTLNQNESTLIISQKTTSNEILQTLDERKNQAWLVFIKDDNNNNSFGHNLSLLLPCSNIKIFDIRNSTLDIICTAIPVFLNTYKQVSIIFAWQLDQVKLNENNDDLAFKQNEELICGTFSRILQTIQKTSPHFHPFVYVLTDHAQFNNDSNLNIIASPFIGLARTSITEYEPYRLKLIDLQTSSSNNNQLIFAQTLVEYMINSRYSTDTCEIVLHLNNDTNQNQVQYLTWHYEMLQKSVDDGNNNEQEKSKLEQISIIPKRDADQKPFRICVPQSRFLSELTWIEEDREQELLPGMVEVRVHCVGINFRDVLKTRGLYPHTRTFAQSEENQPKSNRDTEPGSDFVGTIVRACPTTGFQVGDHIVGATGNGTYHSHIMINSQLIVHIPSECPLTDEQLCGMPTPLLTVIYSLKYRVHLQPNQIVLIHAATGAAGQMCIQYCQYIGAHVIATAGTEEKRRFLHEYYGIEHVFNSRDTSFVNDIRRIFPQGVDVIVNSLSGILLKESIKLLACHGNFIEWGKRDIYHNSNLSMFQLRSDCSFHVIDFAGLADHVSPLIRLMLEEAIDLFVQRKLRAVEPTVTYEPSQVIEALLRCNSGQVMGKTVFRITSSDQPLNIHKKQSNSLLKVVSDNTMFPLEVRNEGTILISGGFGGLGLTMSRWMIEQRGVKHIALMSRRTLVQLEQPSNPQYDDWLRLKQTTKEYNAHVDVVQADVTNFQQVHDLIERFNKTSYPIRGIIHSAVVSEDRTLNALTQEHLSLVLPPKVRGAWYLHQATQLLHAPLHFFIMFSSIRNHLLEVASAGYNAGNQFLDALAHYRFAKLNLPALSISLPAVSGAGMFHRHKEMLSTLKVTQGFELMPTVTVFELIECFHQTQKICPCPVIFAVNWQILHRKYSTLATSYLRKIVEQRYKKMKLDQTSSTSSSSSGKNNSSELHINKKETIIERTQRTVAQLLGAASVDRILIDRSLVSQGMDSLAAISLYNWLGQETGIYIPLIDLLQGLSIETIATLVYNKLNEKEQTTSLTTKGHDSDFDLINENEVQLLNTCTYTGLENIICLHQSNQNNTSILFCITQISNFKENNDLFLFFIDKLSNQKNKTSSNDIYVLQTPLITSSLFSSSISTYAQNLITQMRRIQPCGSYQIVAIRNKPEETIAYEMLKQLKTHSLVSNTQLHLLDDQN